jgi:Cdc6-like AAA superfamily ATPase
MPKRKYQTPEILHAAPLTDKKAADFNFDDFAATFARLIASPGTETPLAIGINGAWGSGKTSLLLRVKNMLDEPNGKSGRAEHRFAQGGEKFRKFKTVWFDAWKYNEEKQLLVALVRVILHAMQRDGFINQLKAWFEDPNQPSYDIAAMFVNAFQASFGGLGAEFKIQLDPGKFKEPSPFQQHTAFFDYFNDAFKRLIPFGDTYPAACGGIRGSGLAPRFIPLIALWVHNSSDFSKIEETEGVLVVFIDDLDRCLPGKTVQTLEALKLFFDTADCIFVLGADTRIVQAAVETHYKNEDIKGESAKDYLDKIIQIRFDLPPIVEKAMEKYLRSHGTEKVDEAMRKRWQALVAAAEVNPRRAATKTDEKLAGLNLCACPKARLSWAVRRITN